MKSALAFPSSHPLSVSAVAGALGVAAFEPAGMALFAPFAVTMLGLTWLQARSPCRAALAGLAFGVVFFGAGVSWVYVSLHTYGMMPAPLAALATVLFCAFLALFPAAVGWAQARLRVTPSVSLLLLLPAAWVLSEWLRGWVFTGFPWLSLGYSQTETPLAGFAPVVGVFGVSLAVALSGGLLALAVCSARRQALAAAAGLVLLLVCGRLLQDMEWTVPHGPPVTVALAQGNVPQEMKFEPGRYVATLATYRKLATQNRARLVVLPETAIPRFLDLVDQTYLDELAALMRERRADLLLGAPLRSRSGAYYNSVASLGMSPSQIYSKVHLVPFGEFVPPGFDWLLKVLHIPLSDFTPGAPEQRPLRLEQDLRVAVNICYEDAFGEEIARQLPEAGLLVNVSNVAWFGDSLAPDQHLQISQMRALETGRFMLRATNSGVTAIIDERGRVLARLPKFTQGVLEGSVQPHSGATPFVRMRNAGALALAIFMLLAAGIVARLRARRRHGEESR